ncbi:SIR2 family protein [Falsiruegeria litorea]|uniref:SIR2 family protein n=1 Tax=Falsiruegeria litorea TaxID=1280831 RepID=UPI001BFCF245|nr:SIR2 family protein [Falsiruegeria litorea]MBT8167483.1 SIR2 family protein [Falsiruegeria litorea]
MRFVEFGPDLPDELLLALDEGRVVFFCGAGVSRAKANLPDFFGLADQVLETLGVPDNAPAVKILNEAREIESRTGVPGLISADRVFGLLERDFLERDIEGAVAKALSPQSGVDLRAHEILLDLATTKEGKTKLVTTNFDRLFDDCGRELDAWQPPRLPDPTRPGDLHGIVYLHGRATERYDGSEGDGFILSSAEFGRAYLAEGWATRFFKDVIDRYSVVFVGYTADDPPVQYLLESLNKSQGSLSEVYAFQSGDNDEASARWQHKGVTAIPYDSKDGHAALWETLEEWSKRAKDPEGWQAKTIEVAQRGPENLSPFEREQVAHLVSTKEGARKFFESDPPAPATWLCVFDHVLRYGKPSKIREGEDEGKLVDPFELFGLSSDPNPRKIDPEDHYAKRDVPTDVWDAFQLNRRDRAELRDDHIASLRGGASLFAGVLPDRINHLGTWLGKVASQSAAVWWAARQHGLHAEIQQRVRWNLERSDAACEPHILQAWHYLFEHWQASDRTERLDWYRFADEVKIIGWNKTTIRKYEALSRPRMTATHNYYHDAVPPQMDDPTDLGRLLMLDVKFTEDTPEFEIPDEWLSDAVAARKRNLEIAIQLETERGHYRWLNIPPIIASDDPNISDYARTEGATGAVLEYANLFERLLALHPEKARREAATWPVNDGNVFARLRIWASRFETLVPNETFSFFFDDVSRESFWETHHQRDLLLTLKERWAKLPMPATRKIEERLLAGRERWENEAEHEFVERNAWAIAERLHWLRANDCALNINYDSEIKRLRNAAPKWKPEFAENADRSWESRGGSVATNTEHASLLNEPLSNVLTKAQELGGRADDFLVENDPFAGLCQSHPVIAVSALRLEVKSGQYPQWAWRRFLNSEKRKGDGARLKNFIAEILTTATDEGLNKIAYPATDWLLSASEGLPEECVPVFERFTRRLLRFLSDNPDAGGSGIVRGSRDPDWATEALNSPAGKIAQALYHDPRRKSLDKNQGFPVEWLNLVEAGLSLPGDNSCFSLVFCTHLLNWFHNVDPKWTEDNLLSILRSNNPEKHEAWWTGYLWGARNLPSFRLFQYIKPFLLAKASSHTYEERDNRDKLAGLVLASWGRPDLETGVERISNNEFRKVLLDAGDRFRSRVLWQLERWSKEAGESGQFWQALQERFLHEVWPVQKAARTPQNSARLIELAFSNEDTFMALSKAILPLLSPIERDHIRLPSIRRGEESIVNNHPERVLEILYLALPENANSWPYEIDATLSRIGEADPNLKQDVRLVELLRRWNNR